MKIKIFDGRLQGSESLEKKVNAFADTVDVVSIVTSGGDRFMSISCVYKEKQKVAKKAVKKADA